MLLVSSDALGMLLAVPVALLLVNQLVMRPMCLARMSWAVQGWIQKGPGSSQQIYECLCVLFLLPKTKSNMVTLLCNTVKLLPF